MLPGIKKINLINPLDLDAAWLLSEFSQISTQDVEMESVPMVGLGELSIQDEIVNNERLYNYSLSAFLSEELKVDDNYIIQITDVEGQTGLIGDTNAPYPEILVKQITPSSVTGKCGYQLNVTYTTNHSLLIEI